MVINLRFPYNAGTFLSGELFSQKVLYSMKLVGESSGLIHCKEAVFLYIHPVCIQRTNNLIARYYATEYGYHTQTA
jgi:hypothetical protein